MLPFNNNKKQKNEPQITNKLQRRHVGGMQVLPTAPPCYITKYTTQKINIMIN